MPLLLWLPLPPCALLWSSRTWTSSFQFWSLTVSTLHGLFSCNAATSIHPDLLCVVQPQGETDRFISTLINDNVDLDGSANGTVTGGASYYSPVIHTTTIGPLQAGVTYYYRVSILLLIVLRLPYTDICIWQLGFIPSILMHARQAQQAQLHMYWSNQMSLTNFGPVPTCVECGGCTKSCTYLSAKCLWVYSWPLYPGTVQTYTDKAVCPVTTMMLFHDGKAYVIRVFWLWIIATDCLSLTVWHWLVDIVHFTLTVCHCLPLDPVWQLERGREWESCVSSHALYLCRTLW